MTARFIHLHCHTEYSLVDGIVRIKPLIKTIREMGMPACAITDHFNLFGLVKFYRAAQSNGIKPIIGVDLRFKTTHKEETPARITLLCQNSIGYHHLTQLISRCYLEGQIQGIPYLQKSWLQNHTEGLIALSGGMEGEIGQSLLMERHSVAQAQLAEWSALFPQRFYLELQRIGQPQEESYIQAAVELALATSTPVVATNGVCFLRADDFEAHEIRVCINQGYTLNDQRRPRLYTAQQYLRTPDEMAELFADIPEAIENTWYIAQRCTVELSLGKNFLPEFPVPTGKTAEEYFTEQAKFGLEHRLSKQAIFQADPQAHVPYDERLQFELNVIQQMGFPGYFLIVADFIQWAKENGIPVGPGRGSGAGSLVAYALGITDLDPLRYELLFERFLNPERVSMPDFDIDFCMERRDDVIKYVMQRYGKERVSQIITHGTMAAKAVVRDVGRVLGHPYGFTDQIAKLIPIELGITLDKALESEEILRNRYQQEEEVRTLLDMARKLEGITRNVGTHAGGVVIAPSQLTDFSALYWDGNPESNIVTQFDKGDIEAVGLVKFDFLGLRTLTIIKWALDNITQFNDTPLDISTIPLDDNDTFDLFKSGNTTAVFQLESSGIKKLVKRLKPDCFEDIVALVALYRPGPLQSGMVDDFIARKHGEAKIEYPHPDLAPILKPTYGVILYQEQVMQIAQVLAGYTLGGADLLRRAMGKKNAVEMAQQRSTFVQGATERHVATEKSEYIFDLMEKFAGYGFNRSHSAAYALISYQTAWLKAHFPSAFMAAVLSADMDNTDKVVSLIEECRQMKLRVLPPHINTCRYVFTVASQEAIYYGLGALKGVGDAALSNIIEERQQYGKFKDLFDLCRRIDLRKTKKRTLETLIKSGALDGLSVADQPNNRAILLASLDTAIKFAEQENTAQTIGQNDIFGALLNTSPVLKAETSPFVIVDDWTTNERLEHEKDNLGLYLSGHPIEQYISELKSIITARLANLESGERSKIAGLVSQVRVVNSKRGKMAAITLDDGTARLEVMVYSDLYQTKREILVKDQLLIIEGDVREDDYTGGYNVTATEILTIEQVRTHYAKRLDIVVSSTQSDGNMAQSLLNILQSHRQGSCQVRIYYQHSQADVELFLGNQWQIKVNPLLLEQVQQLLGKEQVHIIY